ncbi:MAG: hypothetical protein JNK74_18970 [Candidatus Hydrogenedentes bacterium]|nr:hypothetical protein [Candidatus Hydrogenedentota bacterium]
MNLVCRHRFIGLLFTLVALALLPVAAQPTVAPDDPDLKALLQARARAEAYVAEGNLATAITVLLQSMRDAPEERVELADAAYGNGQMIAYVLLHLMPEEAAYEFSEKVFAVETYEIDRMVRTLCYIAIGLETDEKDHFTREAQDLTSSKINSEIVRAITLYFLASPYFYYNHRDFSIQHAELLAKENPNLDLAQTALNLLLYADREKGDFTEVVEAAFKSAEVPPYSPWSASLRARIGECAGNLSAEKEVSPSRAQALQPLLRGITEGSDWRERYFSLLLLKNEFEGDIGTELRAAARSLSATKSNTPDAVMARLELIRALSADCAGKSSDVALRDETLALALEVLEKGVTETTPERVLWESWVYGLKQGAENLAAAGHVDAALTLYGALADRVPGSKIAAACHAAMAALSGDVEPEPVPQGAAE